MRILYFDLDSLSPSHLHCYGYHRKTSPAIDALAAEGVRFENVYCSDAPCLPSRTAFYQSRFGIQTGVVGHGGTSADPRREGPNRGFLSCYEKYSFPRALQKLGFHTAMVSSFGQRHAAHHYYAGFNEVHNQGDEGYEPAELVQPLVDKWLTDNVAKDNWYFHVNYWDPHTPYRTPASYGNPFEGDPLPEWFTPDVVAQHIARAGPHTAQDLGMYEDADDKTFPRQPARIVDRESLKKWIDGYDTGIHYADSHIARVIAMLKRAGVYEDTAIIVSADHGENQGELGIYGEHATADRGTCNIPFIVKWPGKPANAVDRGLHYHLDWAPTCLELLGSDKVPDIWDGRSFASAFTGSGPAASREELILGQCAHVCQRSVRFGPWLYIRTYHDGYHPFPKHQLFNLELDPHEQRNVAEQNPDVLREATWRLTRWQDEQMDSLARRGDDVTDPLWKVMSEKGPFHTRQDMKLPPSLAEYIQRLESTGRQEGAESLRARYAAQLR